MASWWEYEPESKFAVKPPESSGEGDFRFPAAILCGVSAAILFPVAFVAGFMRSYDVALWSFGLGAACVVLLWLLPPKPRKQSHSSSAP